MVTLFGRGGVPFAKTTVDIPYKLWLKLHNKHPYRKGEYIVSLLERDLAGVDFSGAAMSDAEALFGTASGDSAFNKDTILKDSMQALGWAEAALDEVGVTPEIVHAIKEKSSELGTPLYKNFIDGRLKEWLQSGKQIF